MSWSAANNADVVAQSGQLMCFVRALCATCQGTLHALQRLWKMYTAKCQTFIKLLNSFHAREELLCGCGENSEKMTLVWNVSGDDGEEKGKKSPLLMKSCLFVCLLIFVCLWKVQHSFIVLGPADWRSHSPHCRYDGRQSVCFKCIYIRIFYTEFALMRINSVVLTNACTHIDPEKMYMSVAF